MSSGASMQILEDDRRPLPLCALILDRLEQCAYPSLVSGSSINVVVLIALLIFIIELSVVILGVQGSLLAYASFRKSTSEVRALLGATVTNLFIVRGAVVIIVSSIVAGAGVALATGTSFFGNFHDVKVTGWPLNNGSGEALTWREQVYIFLAGWFSWSFYIASAVVLWLPLAALVFRGVMSIILFPCITFFALLIEYAKLCSRNKRCVRRREVIPTFHRVLKRWEPNTWPYIVYGCIDFFWEKFALVCCCYCCKKKADGKGCCPVRAPRIISSFIYPCVLPHESPAFKDWHSVANLSEYPRDDAENPPRVLAHREGTEQRASDLLKSEPPPSLVLLKNRLASYSFWYCIFFGIALAGAPQTSSNAAVISFVLGGIGILKAAFSYCVHCRTSGRYLAIREATVALHVPLTGDDGIVPDNDALLLIDETNTNTAVDVEGPGSTSISIPGTPKTNTSLSSISEAGFSASSPAAGTAGGGNSTAGIVSTSRNSVVLASVTGEAVATSTGTINGSSASSKPSPRKLARPSIKDIAAAREERKARVMRAAADMELKRQRRERNRTQHGLTKAAFNANACLGGLVVAFTLGMFLVMLFGVAPPLGGVFLCLLLLLLGNSALPGPASAGCCSSLAKTAFALLCGAALFLSSSFSSSSGLSDSGGYKLGTLVEVGTAPMVTGPSETAYPSCKQTINGLSVIDHGFLSSAIYHNDSQFIRDVNAWFAPANMTFEVLKMVGPGSNISFAGTGLRFAVLNQTSPAQATGRIHVIIRGSVSNADWLYDFTLWSEALFLNLAGYVSPINTWPLALQKSVASGTEKIVTALNPRKLKSSSNTFSDHNSDVIAEGSPSLQYLGYMENSLRPYLALANSSLSVSGHSLGGGMASMLSQMLDVSSVSFSGPGMVISGGSFLPPVLKPNLPFTIIPDLDPVPRVDKQVGVVADIRCLTLDPGGCHSVERSTCELLTSCGDPYGRTLTSCKEFGYDASKQGLTAL
jgi:Lipase (class 3)